MTMTTKELSRLDIENLPNYKRKTRSGEYSSTCPFCGGKDRFCYWENEGNYWCRQCGEKGFVLDVSQALATEAQREAWREAARRRKEKEREQNLSAVKRVETMQHKVDWYHARVDQALSYWYSQGLQNTTIERYQLGFAPTCPTCQETPSYVIPVYQQYKLVSIRHRLARPNGSGKYRPEFTGLPAQIFNTDALKQDDEIPFGVLDPDEAVLVEGEVKAMVLDQLGFTAAGTPGFNAWTTQWKDFFKGYQTVYIAFDPGDTLDKAFEIAETLRTVCYQVRIATLPVKPDDFFVRYGGNIDDFVTILKQGRLVR